MRNTPSLYEKCFFLQNTLAISSTMPPSLSLYLKILFTEYHYISFYRKYLLSQNTSPSHFTKKYTYLRRISLLSLLMYVKEMHPQNTHPPPPSTFTERMHLQTTSPSPNLPSFTLPLNLCKANTSAEYPYPYLSIHENAPTFAEYLSTI